MCLASESEIIEHALKLSICIVQQINFAYALSLLTITILDFEYLYTKSAL